MKYNFKIQNGRLISGGWPYGFTGNVNTYICHFDIECSIEGIMWFCIFKQGESVYRQLIENGSCIIPQEVLKNPEPLYIGCYGTNADNNIKRVSTNLICFNIKHGAYSESTIPEVPTPDVWELLINKTVPIIGENGNWFIYDMNKGDYIDSGCTASGSGGGSSGKDGLSAYEIALNYGFEGTEEEWLKSLRGKDGANGKDGADGYTPTAEQLQNINKIPTIEQTATGALGTAQSAWDKADEAIQSAEKAQLSANTAIGNVEQAAINAYNALNMAGTHTKSIENLQSNKQDKAIISYEQPDTITGYFFNVADSYNKDIRLYEAPLGVYIYFPNDAYANDYIAGLGFYCGETPPWVSYEANGIINWVGTDCTTDSYIDDSGVETQVSIFQPSANTHYDIVFYFNGTQFIGLVNGFKPASGNVVSE